jgi:SAM-dependent methyltransferase
VFSSYPGYVKGTTFDIYECSICDTTSISPLKSPKEIYDAIYSNTTGSKKVPGYDRYYEYAVRIKKSKDPMKFLAHNELAYVPIREYVKNKDRLDILDIGCGYGYLTYALSYLKHNATGIDISKSAIDFATENFGKNFLNADINSVSKKKFDLIVATELIEHLTNPEELVRKCSKLLKKDGRIIFTTPNKEYHTRKGVAWGGELPPVHTVILSSKSFQHIAEANNLNLEFFDFRKHSYSKESKAILFIDNRRRPVLPPTLLKDGSAISRKIKRTPLNIMNWAANKLLWIILVRIHPTRALFNKLHDTFIKKQPTLCAILWKKHNQQ